MAAHGNVATAAALALCIAAALTGSASAAVGAAAAAGNAAAAAGSAPEAVVGAVPSPALAAQCKSSVSVSPWDIGNHFPNVILCCGGSIDFQWSGSSGVWQLATATCPATFTNSTTARQLLPTTQGSGGIKALYLPTPGTFFITSPVASVCAQGLLFQVRVPPGSGSVCPVTPAPVTTAAPTTAAPTTAAPTPAPSKSVSASPSSLAAAEGVPGGQSTSTSPGSSAAASGPANSSFTATRPGEAFSMAGGRRRMQRTQL